MESIIIFRTSVDGGERALQIECDIYSPDIIVRDNKFVTRLYAGSVSINEKCSDKDYKSFFEITIDDDNNSVVEFKNAQNQICISIQFTEYDGPHWEINIIGE